MQGEITIVAASDLRYALDSLVNSFKKDNPGSEVKVIYGSSGKLFEQISNEAPFDLFFSADISFPQKLKEKGLAISEVTPYGIGRIVLWSKKTDPNKNQMNSLLDPSINKIAIADPTHAPYGARAEESLKYYQLYDKVKSKLVFGENISQAAQFVSTGAADIGIIALSIALSPNVQKEGGKYYLIPEESHTKLEQAFVVLKHAEGNQLAASFAKYVSTKPAKDILRFYGFSEQGQ